jgi:hypothetical protein
LKTLLSIGFLFSSTAGVKQKAQVFSTTAKRNTAVGVQIAQKRLMIERWMEIKQTTGWTPSPRARMSSLVTASRS